MTPRVLNDPTGAALFQAVATDPDDDTPRLVFADWLDENELHPPAALIRGQLAGSIDPVCVGEYAQFGRGSARIPLPKVYPSELPTPPLWREAVRFVAPRTLASVYGAYLSTVDRGFVGEVYVVPSHAVYLDALFETVPTVVSARVEFVDWHSSAASVTLGLTRDPVDWVWRLDVSMSTRLDAHYSGITYQDLAATRLWHARTDRLPRGFRAAELRTRLQALWSVVRRESRNTWFHEDIDSWRELV